EGRREPDDDEAETSLRGLDATDPENALDQRAGTERHGAHTGEHQHQFAAHATTSGSLVLLGLLQLAGFTQRRRLALQDPDDRDEHHIEGHEEYALGATHMTVPSDRGREHTRGDPGERVSPNPTVE